tara:strand:- start:2368 stop:2910 length:543 start_codon:yes stop_codon:yes gene_type:complete
MKTISTFVLLLSVMILSAQETSKKLGLFYKLGVATTLTINEDYVVGDDEDNEAFFRFNAFFLNNTIGYKFDPRSSIGINLEYDWHSESGLMFMPLHLSFRYNVIQKDENVFIRSSYGRLLDVGNSFEAGSLYKVGIGAEIFNEASNNSGLVGIEFTQKSFGFREEEKLVSISFFLEVSFL